MSTDRREQAASATTSPVAEQSKRDAQHLFRRLRELFSILFPSLVGRESFHFTCLTCLLYARTALSIRVAEHTGRVASRLVQAQWQPFVQAVGQFALLGIPAALCNAALNFETTMLALCFRERLTQHIHNMVPTMTLPHVPVLFVSLRACCVVVWPVHFGHHFLPGGAPAPVDRQH